MAIISMDIDTTINVKESIGEIINVISERIVYWNIHKKYKNFRINGLKSNEGNWYFFLFFIFLFFYFYFFYFFYFLFFFIFFFIINFFSQDFVEDILSNLGYDTEKYFKGCYKEFLKEIKNKGICDLIFKPSEKFKKKFDIKENQIEFKTHREIDEFIYSLIKKDSFFLVFKEEEYCLLKSFDRGIYLFLFLIILKFINFI